MKATAEEFVTVWLAAHREGHNAAWVAGELDMSTQAVYERVAKLKDRGVKLPKLPRFDKQQAQRLNALVAEQLDKRPNGRLS